MRRGREEGRIMVEDLGHFRGGKVCKNFSHQNCTYLDYCNYVTETTINKLYLKICMNVMCECHAA